MRRGTRRGQSIADELRIFVRGDVLNGVPSPESSPDTPSSVASSPSPTTPAFPAATKIDSPSPTTTTFPPPAVTKTDSPSPTTTTFPPMITSSSSAVPFFNHPELSSTAPALPSSVIISSVSTAPVLVTTQPIQTTTALALAPAIPGSTLTTSRTPILSNAPTSSATAARQVQADATITTSSSVATETLATSTDGLGPVPIRHDENGRIHLDAGSVAGIAVGSSAGTIFIVALLFLLYKKWNRRTDRDDSDNNSNAGSSVRQYLPRRFTHKSDDRIMNELMTAAYSAENGGGRNSYQDKMPVNVNGYLMEEKQRSLEEGGDDDDDEMPVMVPEPEPVARPGFKRTKRISKWLGRQDREMLNPMSARASFVSNATGLRTLDLRSMSGWGGSDDGYSEYTRSTEPPSRLRPPPRQKPQPEPAYPEPLRVARDEPEDVPDVQGLGVQVRDSTPIEQFPSPEALNLPPPPGRPPSVAAPTEVTGRSSGTWNTWGVMQHREEPKGWKSKLGM